MRHETQATKFHFSRGDDANAGKCQIVTMPKCGKDEAMILNEFGHPVCVCKTNENVFPLQSSLRYQKDEKTLKKCFANDSKDSNVCQGTFVDVTKAGELTCTSKPVITGFNIFGGGYICRDGYTFVLNGCRQIKG